MVVNVRNHQIWRQLADGVERAKSRQLDGTPGLVHDISDIAIRLQDDGDLTGKDDIAANRCITIMAETLLIGHYSDIERWDQAWERCRELRSQVARLSPGNTMIPLIFTLSSGGDDEISRTALRAISGWIPIFIDTHMNEENHQISTLVNVEAVMEMVSRVEQAKNAQVPAGMSFYRREAANNNKEDQMIFRLALSDPFPSTHWPSGSNRTINMTLVNEINLFPHDAMPPNRHVGIQACVYTLAHISNVNSRVELVVTAARGFTGSRRGSISFSLACDCDMKDVYVKLTAVDDDLNLIILPIVFGPLIVSRFQENDTCDVIYTHRQLGQTILRESPSDLAGKVWDSALFVAPLAVKIVSDILSDSDLNEFTILDLSAGTGVVGIYMYNELTRLVAGTSKQIKVIATEVAQAIDLIKTNAQLNGIIPVNDATSHQIQQQQQFLVKPLLWGQDLEDSNFPKVDMVIACDVIYESQMLPLLCKTICDLEQTNNIKLVVGYKSRGLYESEVKSLFWDPILNVNPRRRRRPLVDKINFPINVNSTLQIDSSSSSQKKIYPSESLVSLWVTHL